MVFTKIDLCSRALMKLGERPIVSFSEDNPASQLSNNLYDGVLEFLLASHPWDFAKEKLRMVYSSRLDDGRCVFSIPSDCLRILSIDETQNYEIMGLSIYAPVSTIFLNYIKKVDESLLPSYFSSVLILRLAMEFCLPLTENQTLYRTVSVMYDNELKTAKYIDSSQASENVVRNFSLINSRFE